MCLVATGLSACGGGGANSPTLTNRNTATTNQTTVSQTSTQSAHTPATTASPRASAPTASAAAGGGEFVDTSRYDAEIKRLEQQSKKNPSDQQARQALARAYTDRGDALTGVRQYRSALGDYRRALRLDPNDQQARQMNDTIIGILKSMGRDVPAEGQEPPPLQQ